MKDFQENGSAENLNQDVNMASEVSTSEVQQGTISVAIADIKPAKRSKLSLTTRKNLMGYWFVLPFILGMVLLYIPALIEAFRYSISTIDIVPGSYELNYVGLDNYRHVLQVDPTFIRSIFETTGDLFINVAIILIYSLIMATVLNRNIGGKGFYRALLFLPVIIATGVITEAENTTFTNLSSGSLDIEAGAAIAGGLFSEVDITLLINSLSLSPELTDIVVGAINNIYSIVTGSGVQLIIFLAGLQSISPTVYESATVEGATWWESFWKITIPMISPLILVNMVYTVVDSFTRYGNPVMDGIFELISQAVYTEAAARAFVYLVIVGVIIAAVMAIVNKFVFYENR